MEGMAGLGVSARGGRDELDCYLCHVLDHDRICRGGLKPSLRRRFLARRADLPACTAGLRRNVGVLVHSVLDVPAENILEDMSEGGAGTKTTELPR